MKKQCIMWSLIGILGATSLLSAITFDSDFGPLTVDAVDVLNEEGVFAKIPLSGFNDPDNQTHNLIDDDGFFSLALLIHAYKQKSGGELNIRQLSEDALWFVAGKLPGYMNDERSPELERLKTHLKAVIGVTPLDIQQCVDLLRKLKYAEVTPTTFDDLLAEIKHLLDKKKSLSDHEWFTALELVVASHSAQFQYSVEKIVYKPVGGVIGGLMPGSRPQMYKVTELEPIRLLAFKFDLSN